MGRLLFLKRRVNVKIMKKMVKMDYQEIMVKMEEIFMLILNFTITWINSLLMYQVGKEVMGSMVEMV